MSELSIFSRIINGEIPSHKVYEDDKVFAFLDIHPITPGHTLVVPKKQVQFVWELTDEDYAALTAAAKKIALHLRDVLGVPFVGEQIIGVDVPHAHLHLIPFTDAREFHNIPDQSAEPDHVALKEIAQKVAF